MISYASWPKKQNLKQKPYCNKFIKDFFKEGKKLKPVGLSHNVKTRKIWCIKMSQEGRGEDKDRKTSGARSFAGSVWEVNVQATAVFGETLHGGPLDELAQHWLLSDREQGQGGKQPW